MSPPSVPCVAPRSDGAAGPSVHIDEPLGESSRPFTAADLMRKFGSLAGPALGAQRAAGIADRVMALEQQGSVRDLARLLRRQE